MTEPSIGELIERRVHDETHECIRPACAQRSSMAYYVDKGTRLAGRDLAVGDFIDVCPADDYELRRAAGVAKAAGWGGPFDDLLLRLHDTGLEVDPFARFRDWR